MNVCHVTYLSFIILPGVRGNIQNYGGTFMPWAQAIRVALHQDLMAANGVPAENVSILQYYIFPLLRRIQLQAQFF